MAEAESRFLNATIFHPDSEPRPCVVIARCDRLASRRLGSPLKQAGSLSFWNYPGHSLVTDRRTNTWACTPCRAGGGLRELAAHIADIRRSSGTCRVTPALPLPDTPVSDPAVHAVRASEPAGAPAPLPTAPEPGRSPVAPAEPPPGTVAAPVPEAASPAEVIPMPTTRAPEPPPTVEVQRDERLAEAAALMDESLSLVCGLSEKDRKLVTYYTLATHALGSLNTFPLLVFKGPMGTGKSQALLVVAAFACRPRAFSLRAMTLPTIRDELAACCNGTAAIEEADSAWKDLEAFERMLSDRYQRATAKGSYKQVQSDKTFSTVNPTYFGATVLHRRQPFTDAALNGRSVIVRSHADHTRTYDNDPDNLPPVMRGRKLVEAITALRLPAIQQPPTDCGPHVRHLLAPCRGCRGLWRHRLLGADPGPAGGRDPGVEGCPVD